MPDSASPPLAVATSGVLESASAASVRPYPPSFLDRILDRIDRLPGHGWWVYLLVFLIGAVYTHAVVWWFGRVPFGRFDASAAGTALYGPYALAAIHYLDRSGRRAMREFRPALDLPDEAVEARGYELVTLPAGSLWPWLGIGALVAAAALLPELLGAGARGPSRFEVVARIGPPVVFGFALIAVLAFHTVRQLRMVARIQREAPRMDLFLEKPLFAFSRLTMRTAIVFLLLGYYFVTINGGFVSRNPIGVAILVLTFAVGIACFVIPVWGIHTRLLAERERLVVEANERIKRATAELYRRVDALELSGTSEVSDALGGVIAARDLVRGLPVWPWPPDVLSAFVTALILPVLVFVVTSQLGGAFG